MLITGQDTCSMSSQVSLRSKLEVAAKLRHGTSAAAFVSKVHKALLAFLSSLRVQTAMRLQIMLRKIKID